jgi:hypothetical protein
MSRIIEFPTECEYQRLIRNTSVIWQPEINATFQSKTGKSRRGRALVDSGATWCAMPKDVAADYFGVDVSSCPLETIEGATGPTRVPYTTMMVRAVDVEAECKVLLMDSRLYLVGRIPFFSLFDVAFHEETNGSNNRILFAKK